MKLLKKIAYTEPAVLRGIVGALVTIMLLWAPRLADLGTQITKTSDIVFGTLMPLLVAVWIRGAVYSPASADGLVADAAETGVPAVPTPPSDPAVSPEPVVSEETIITP